MNLNIIKPNKKNLYTYLVLGIGLLSIGFIDIFFNTFLNSPNICSIVLVKKLNFGHYKK